MPELKADLLNQGNFVNVYLSKLWPNADVDWRHDAKAREAYLDRLWSFVSKLNPVHNSMKAHVLYHRLAHDRVLGTYDKNRFATYIKLPRSVNYANRDYLNRDEHRRHRANLGADYRKVTMLPSVGNDEPLVRSYLQHFFKAAKSYKPYDVYLDDKYLKRCFAETKILAGVGDMEEWYSMLTPSEYQALKERVDLDFAPTNKNLFQPQEQVALDLYTKNVETLIVKVFEINALNFYRTNGRELDTTIDLDGLVTGEEKTYTYGEPALRRVKRHFEFPSLEGRGTYVVEFIGGGKSSRALIRKGKLGYIARTSIAGQVFTILDEASKKIPDASLWLSGHHYRADDDGTITVPFSARPGRQSMILVQGDFALLESFKHQSEQYKLSAGIHVERESLIKRKKATVVVRPGLSLNGSPVTLTVLEDPVLVIVSTDREGVSTTQEIKDFKLFEDKDSIHEFQVPAKLAQIHFTLKARVQNMSQNKKLDLQVRRSFVLNRIDATDKLEDLHLSHPGGQYFIDLLGKTGEIKPDRPVHVTLKHRDFRDVVEVSLQSNPQGRVALGEAKDIDWIRARGPEGTQHTWYLSRDLHSYPRIVHGRAGDAVLLPYMGNAKEALREELALLEKRGDTYVRDRFAALSIQDGFVQIRDLPAGDYDLWLKNGPGRIALRLTQGERRERYVLSPYRQLQVSNPRPLQIAVVKADKEAVHVHLQNSTKYTRVHVIATRYLPEYPLYAALDAIGVPDPSWIVSVKAETQYVVGRDIGDEYRYILERKHAKTYPGNMLKRPSLLLNPWAIRSTETGRQDARGGGEYDKKGKASESRRGLGEAEAGGRAAAREGGFANLDFLGEPAVVLTNLKADEKGNITIKRADLGAHHQLHIVAVDPLNTAYRELSLEEAQMEFSDLRLIAGLDPKGHYTEQKKTSIVQKGKEFALADLTTSDFETYDSLDKVHALFATLSGNPTLVEFGFILQWPKLKPEEKREKYTKYACHELNFFLLKKDPKFFNEVVKPYIKNKKDKTFLDHWLLGDDLAEYLKPWPFAQLNIVERILIAQRIQGESPHAARHVQDLLDLIPPNVEHLNHLFRTAIKGRALDTADDYGLEKAKDANNQLQGVKLGALRTASRSSRARPRELAPTAEAAAAEVMDAPADKIATHALKRLAGKRDRLEEKEMEALSSDLFFRADGEKRKAIRQLYRKLEKTKEWVENNYYHLPIEQQNANLITVNAFWRDYAHHDGKLPFFSTHLAEASRSFAEMMFALSVLELPFAAQEHKSKIDGTRFSLVAGSPMLVYHKEIQEAQPAEKKIPILVSQNFYRHGDRYTQVGNERFDKYITEEFLVHTAYGCHVVITNPTSSRQKLDVLLQVPRGAIPVQNGHYTRSLHVDLEPYRTWTSDYLFYFPAAGDYPHYPVHVARSEKLVAFAPAVVLHVVESPTKLDRASWDYLSQNGTEEQVLAYLEENNLGRVKLERIAWRMGNRAFLRKVVSLLERRHVYNHILWSYSIKHNMLAAMRQYLQHCNSFVQRCGAAIDCKLLTIDPVERKAYQHMEYWPLVNARAHQLGGTRKILNNRFFGQYMGLMRILAYRPRLDDDDLMSVTYYLLLQDRVEEALDHFQRVRAGQLATQLQYDYFNAYLGFYTEDLRRSRTIAEKYAAYPVDRWRNFFANVIVQLDEIEGRAAKVLDEEDRTQVQTQLADTEPSFEFEVESRKVTIRYQNLGECRVNYYPMDIELLFSRNPFVQQYSGQFSYVRPNHTDTVKLKPKKNSLTFELPERFRSSNVLIEILGAGVKKTRTYFANTLALQLIENYGQVKVTHQESGKPLSKVYVKVYALMKDRRVRFYKDGYTDLRGRFDYGSLSTNELDNVSKFSILVLSKENGAVVREADPPKR